MDDIAIRTEHVSKTFRLPHNRNTSIKGAFINAWRGQRRYENQLALKDVSFEVRRGEFFGIVGRNGSGKSTLLKLLAGIYTPDQGYIEVNGKLTPFIELGVGFSPELTGRENVFLNGSLLGFSRAQMRKMYKDIVSFAELERFMDQKLKNYSSGMQVRLAFSIAIKATSDILLIDEVLAVGDLDFQQKCYNYFNDLKRQGRTVVFVTHDMAAVRRFCDRAILVNKGDIVESGSPNDIARAYEKINLESAGERLAEANQSRTFKHREGDGAAVIDSVETFDTKTGKSQTTFYPDQKIGVRITYKIKRPIESPSLGFIFQDEKDRTVFATNNQTKKVRTETVGAGDTIVVESAVDGVFTDGQYSITCAIESQDVLTIHDRIEYVHKFLVGGYQLAHATTHPRHDFNVKYVHKGS